MKVQDTEMPTEAPVSKPKGCGICRYPKSTFFILGDEFCERFSFVGMQAVLILYLITIHELSESSAKLIYHAFIFVCYFTPLLGSILADGILGRYKTILFGSILYCVGHILLTLGSIPSIGKSNVKTLDYIGLFTIAISTGAIKPCVQAFAADQFPPGMKSERIQFFSYFYLVVNCAAILSVTVTPIFRGKVTCLGENTCFPLAFGVPGALMLLALIIFCCGKPFYVIRKQDRGQNVICQVVKCVVYAFKQRFKSGCNPENRSKDVMDYAVGKYGHQLVSDIKGLQKLVVLFIPLIFFGTVFNQLGSTWVLQANRMNGNIGPITILPDQISILNPIIVSLLIPILETAVYPCIRRINPKWDTPLKRIGFGGVLATLSFIIAGFIQLKVNQTSGIKQVQEGYSRIFFQNPTSCDITATGIGKTIVIPGLKEEFFDTKTNSINLQNSGCNISTEMKFDLPEIGAKTAYFLSTLNFPSETSTYSFDPHKVQSGMSKLLVFGTKNLQEANTSLVATQSDSDNQQFRTRLKTNGTELLIQTSLKGSKSFRLSLERCSMQNCSKRRTILEDFTPGIGAVYGISIQSFENAPQISIMVPSNSFSILWQIPQYIAMSSSEILFAITGISFSYEEAAPSMKSVVQAMFLLTIAIGNVITMFISGSRIVDEPATEFFIYACLMGCVTLVFIFLAHRYTYANRESGAAGQSVPKNEETEL